jgi:peptidyl-prolyl cis-trans isomerase SurA
MNLKKAIVVSLMLFVGSCVSVTLAKSLPAPVNTSRSIDSIVAVVNNDVVTQVELQRQMRFTAARIKSSGVAVPPVSELRSTVIDQLINQKIQLQMAKKSGIKVSNNQVRKFMASLAQQQGISLSVWRQRMYAQGYHRDSLQQALRVQITLNQIQHLALAKNLQVTRGDTAKLKKQMQARLSQATLLKITDVLVTLPDVPTHNQLMGAKALANAVIQKLRAGQSASQLSGVQVSTWKWQSMMAIPNLFISALTNKAVGSVVGPIRAGNGFHVLKLLGRRQATASMPTNAQIKQVAFQRKYMAALEKWIKGLRKTAYINIIQP